MAIYNLLSGLAIQSSVDLPGSTSGTVSISAPAIAGTQSYTLPTALPSGSNFVLSSDTSGNLTWLSNASGGGGTVTSVSVVSANGFAGSVATATTTPAITIRTSIGTVGTPVLLIGNGTAISAFTNSTTIAGAAISGSSIVFRDIYLTTATPNRITISAPPTVTSSISYTWPTTAPANRNILSSDTSGNMSWISNIANPSGTPAVNYTAYANINIDDIFVGMAPTPASFGQNFTVDGSDVALSDMIFHQKPILPVSNNILNQIRVINSVVYDDTPVNGISSPLYMGIATSSTTATGSFSNYIVTSTDGVNWRDAFTSSNLAASSVFYGFITVLVSGTAPSQVRTWTIYSSGSTPFVTRYSTDNGATWTGGTSLAGATTSAEVIDNTIYVAVSATTNLYKSTNGSTFTSVTNGTTNQYGSIFAGPGSANTRNIYVSNSSGTSGTKSTDGGATFSATGTTIPATVLGNSGIYDTLRSQYCAFTSSNFISSSDGVTWTTGLQFTLPNGITAATPQYFNFSYLNSNGGAVLASYVTRTGFTLPALNYMMYTDDGGATIKYKQMATGMAASGPIVGGGTSITPEILFIHLRQYNQIGFRKKYLYVDDANGISKAPLGTYKCLGKAGTESGSYLWRRIS